MILKESSLVEDTHEEIPALIETLLATEQRLEELTEGQVDSVAGRDGRTFVLRRAQDQLRHNEALKQSAILNALPAHIALLDGQGFIISVNEAWRRFADENALDVPGHGVGLNYLAICEQAQGGSSTESHQIAAGIRDVLDRREHSFSIEYPCHSPTEPGWFLMTASQLAHDHANGAVVMHLNVTARKLAASALEELLERTDRRERMLTTMLSHLNDFTYIYDRAGCFLFANQPLLDLWGLTLNEVVGKNFHQLGYPDDLARRLEQELREVFETGKSVTGENPYVSPTGLEGNYEYIFSPAFAATGDVEFVVGSTRDITERKGLEAQLRQGQKMEAIGTLAGGIAHDFNNILAAIMGYTELAQNGLSPDGRAHAQLAQVLKASGRAKDLVQQILTFSRQEEHEQHALRVQDIIEETLDLIRASLPATIEIKQTIDHGVPLILGDATQIQQVIMNLCLNAGHAMKQENGILGISLTSPDLGTHFREAHHELGEGPCVLLSISDTGCGIDRIAQTRIFDPFYTTKAPGEGTGLGLAVVHGIVKNHRAVITVQSEVGVGTTFSIYLPACERGSGRVTQGEVAIPRGNGEHILFVDDEETLASLGKLMLEDIGYRVTAKIESIEALKAFRSHPEAFDLVITDQTMPGLKGADFATALLEIRPELPVILLTGYSSAVSPEIAKARGIREMLLKPCPMHVLGEAIQRALRG